MSVLLSVSGNQLHINGKTYRCAIGKGGFTNNKREGDGCTPLGMFSLRECWFRPDRLPAPMTGLPLRPIQPADGWCDDPASPDYNRHITLPCDAGSYEHLWREEPVYDVIVPLGYNDGPVIPGKGSAIFLHVAKPDYAPTEGCVALRLDDLLEVLMLCNASSLIDINITLVS